MIYDVNSSKITHPNAVNGDSLNRAYNINTDIVFGNLPVPSGNLTASSTVALPDLYETGKGFTCTGLTYDEQSNTFLVGDIGKLQASGTTASQIVRLSADFSTVDETIDLHSTFTSMQDVQGVTIDTSDGSIWFCSPSEDVIRNIDASGQSIGYIGVNDPTGIAYAVDSDSLWVLTYDQNIINIAKDGTTLATYAFAYNEALDQCFYDVERGYLYITAGTNYSTANNVYLFDTVTHEQSIACTVDSYSVEGIWIGADKMVIVNDGYYHSAAVAVNQANIYSLRGADYDQV